MGSADKLAMAVKKVLDAPEQVRSGQATPATKYAASPVPAESQLRQLLWKVSLVKKAKPTTACSR
jgi:hypothetical protein